jgi:hypothetical protein
LRRDDCTDIFQCETCTRILYYVEAVPAAVAPAGSADVHADGASATNV